MGGDVDGDSVGVIVADDGAMVGDNVGDTVVGDNVGGGRDGTAVGDSVFVAGLDSDIFRVEFVNGGTGTTPPSSPISIL